MDLTFTIKTAAELAGAEATARSLEMQIGKAKALKQDYSGLQAQLETVNSSFKNLSPELEKLHAGEEEAGKAAEFMHHNHRALHMMLHQLGSQTVPELGHALGGMMMGPLGPALALMAAFEGVKKAVEACDEASAKAAENTANATFAAQVNAVKTSFDDAAGSIATYTQHMGELAAHHVTIAAALGRQLQLMKDIATEEKNQRKAKEDLDKAERERQVKMGEMTPEQAQLKETEAAIAAVKAEAKAKRDAEDEAQAKRQAALTAEVQQQGELSGEYAEKEKALAERKARRAGLMAEFGDEHGISDREREEKAKKKMMDDTGVLSVEEAERNRREAQDNALRHINASPAQQERDKQTEQAAAAEVKRARGFQEYWENRKHEFFTEFSSSSNAAFAAQGKDVDTARSHAEQNEVNIQAHHTEFEAEKTRQATVRPGEDKELADRIAEILQQAVTKLADSKHGGELKTAIDVAAEVEKATQAGAIAKQYQSGGKITPEQAEFMMRFANEHGANAQTVDQSSAYVVKNFGNVAQHEATQITQQNQNQLTEAEKYLVIFANNLGAHVDTVKAAADFIIKLRDNTDGFFTAVTTMSKQGFTAIQKQIDAMAVTVAALVAKSNNLQL